jgi:hypothetical protein
MKNICCHLEAYIGSPRTVFSSLSFTYCAVGKLTPGPRNGET